MSVKAVLCKQYGPPETLVVEELPSPRAGPGEAVVSVKAASVNFPDVLIIQNKYQFKPPLPFSPGSELAGVVKEVGPDVKNVKPGDKVIAFTTYGAFAEEVKTEAHRLIPLPSRMDFSTGAAFLLTYGTSDHALRDRASLKAGETLLVLGAAGGVGLAAIEIGKALGARVIACASTDDKLAVCREHGADEAINYTTEDLRERIKAITNGKGVDVVYDAVGGPYSEPAFRSIAWRGRAERGLAVGAADRVEHHVHAFSVRDRLDALAQVLGRVVDRLVRAVLSAHRELVIGRRAGDDACAERLADFDRREPDAARRAEHQQRLAGLETGPVAQRVIRRAIGQEKRGTGGKIHPGRKRNEPMGLRFDFLGERAVGGERDDLVAGLDVLHVRPDFLHHARELASRR